MPQKAIIDGFAPNYQACRRSMLQVRADLARRSALLRRQ